jgi:hypothetical protein
MKFNSAFWRLAAVLGVFALSTPAMASIIVNGDFESVEDSSGYAGNLTTVVNLQNLAAQQWGVFQFIPGWQLVSGSGIEVQRSTIVGAKSSTNYVELDADVTTFGQGSNSGMKQVVALTPGSYNLSFWYRPRINTAGTNGLLVSIAGLTQIPADGVSSNVNDWVQYSDTFNVSTAGNYDLTIQALGLQDGLGGFLDDIALVQAVPEPSTFLLGGGALLLFGFRRRFFGSNG